MGAGGIPFDAERLMGADVWNVLAKSFCQIASVIMVWRAEHHDQTANAGSPDRSQLVTDSPHNFETVFLKQKYSRNLLHQKLTPMKLQTAFRHVSKTTFKGSH